MIKKILSLFFCMIMLSGVIYGCDRTPNKRDEYKSLDTDKAADVALEYMNNKYDKEFQVVSSEKYAKYSFVPGVIQDCWCDVEFKIKDSESDETYTVRVINTENKEEYIIKWDNYMTSLVKPWLKEQMDEILSQLDIECFTILWSANERNSSGFGFSSEFKHIDENDSLKEIANIYNLSLTYCIVIPSSSYNATIDYSIEKIYREYFPQDFNGDYSGDCVNIEVCTYTDDFYDKYKKAVIEENQEDNELENSNRYEVHYNKIYLN